jgi:transcriptional regulator with XRE-family HTH domain
MDQIKIGKFIAETRKERNMTQLDLARKLGVTDRAVSKWENGRGMPDISLIKPLCDELSVSVNELFCGERIREENLTQKAEENIVNTLKYSKKKIKKVMVFFISAIATVMSVIILIATLFAVDINRMRNNKPVLFSTWGFDYAPPIDLKEEEIQLAIKDYLVTHGDNEEKHQDGVKTFVAFRVYLLEEFEKDALYNVYAWVLEEQCYLDGENIKSYGGYSMPFKFTVKNNQADNGFYVSDSRYPRDGSYYADDMKNLFSRYVRNEMENIHNDGTFERLQMEINEQTKLYFHK